MKEENESSIAMQTHCLGCGNEIYAPAVYQWSHGGLECQCGYRSIRMTDDLWFASRREFLGNLPQQH